MNQLYGVFIYIFITYRICCKRFFFNLIDFQFIFFPNFNNWQGEEVEAEVEVEIEVEVEE